MSSLSSPKTRVLVPEPARIIKECFEVKVDNQWLMRPCKDGGTDYVCFRGPGCMDQPRRVEMLLGSHLPPQMPLLKRRQWMGVREALVCCDHLKRNQGYSSGPPLF